jgi:hypothetical protein
MRKKVKWIRRISLVLLPAILAAAEGGGNMVIVADSRHLTGVRAWWANLYNQSHLQFALMTIVLVPLAGVILGSVADLLIGRIGIDLKSRVLREG